MDRDAAIYDRTAMRFERAKFLKPDSNTASGRTFDLAPLIVQQVEGAAGAMLAAVVRDSAGQPVLDPARPTMYFAEATATLSGVAHEQLIYVWFYPREPAAASAPAASRGARPGSDRRTPEVLDISWRAVRITLAADGFPAIAETFSSDDATAVMYVSHALEKAAAAQFGPPLPGRRHAVERSQAEQPDVVVARVLDDGPLPMGPAVYVDAPTRTITTLLCRCMPSQFESTVESIYYDMKPLESLADLLVTAPALIPGGAADLTSDHPERGGAKWLQRALRLPEAF